MACEGLAGTYRREKPAPYLVGLALGVPAILRVMAAMDRHPFNRAQHVEATEKLDALSREEHPPLLPQNTPRHKEITYGL